MNRKKQIIKKTRKEPQIPEVTLIRKIAAISERAKKIRLSSAFDQTKFYKV